MSGLHLSYNDLRAVRWTLLAGLLCASACSSDDVSDQDASEAPKDAAAPAMHDAGPVPERDAGRTSTDSGTGQADSGSAAGSGAGPDAGSRDGGPRFDACTPQDQRAQVDDGCREEVCHVAIRLAYSTLEPRGWSVSGGRLEPVTRGVAVALARAAAEDTGNDESLLWSETDVSGPSAGVFTVAVDPLDFGAVALVGADSGEVILAAGVVYSGAGEYWVPSAWRPASEIACGREAVEPSTRYLGPDTCADAFPMVPAASPSEALELALRSNVASAFAARGAFAAHVHLYTPTVGSCSAERAEYVVVLSQQRWAL